jgi:outer membrane receptor protein involved in Fe transport
MSASLTDAQEKITSDYTRERYNKEYELERTLNANFQHDFEKEDQVLEFDLNLLDNFEVEDNKYTNVYRTPALSSTYNNVVVKNGDKETNFIAGYTYPISDSSKLEAGYSTELLRLDMDFAGEYYDPNLNTWLKDHTVSKRFLVKQDIHALYGTYSRSIKKFSYMTGLRMEQALVTSRLLSLDSIVPNNYFKIYPGIHLSYQINNRKEVQLNYSNRVNRPDPDDMNPFPEYRDPRNLRAGNPYLKPEQIHSVEFGYKFSKNNFSLIPSLYYKYRYNAFTQISKFINDSTLLTTYENLSTDESAGSELIVAVNVKKLLSLNFSTNVFYNKIDASNLGYSDNKTTIAANVKLGANINVSKTTMLQINSSYRSSMLTPQGKYLPSFILNAGMRQDLFKRKASVSLIVSDMFNTLNWTNIIDTPAMYQKVVSKRKSRIIYLGFSYRFGKSTIKVNEDLKFDERL